MRFSYKKFSERIFWYFWTFRWNWQDFVGTLEALEHQSDLRGLIRWAEKKRIRKVKDYYRDLLIQIEGRLTQRLMRNRRIFALAEWVYAIQKQLIPKSTYQTGFAQKYRRRQFVT